MIIDFGYDGKGGSGGGGSSFIWEGTGYEQADADSFQKKMQADIDYAAEAKKKYEENGDIARDKKLVIAPKLDLTGKSSLSFQDDTALIYVPIMDLDTITDLSYCFHSCAAIQDLPFWDLKNVKNMDHFAAVCKSLLHFPKYDTRNVEIASFLIDINSKDIKTFPALDFGNVKECENPFGYPFVSTPIEQFGGFQNIKVDFNIVPMHYIDKPSIMNVINGLYDFRGNGDASTTRSVSIYTDIYNMLTPDEIKIATDKGWSIIASNG